MNILCPGARCQANVRGEAGNDNPFWTGRLECSQDPTSLELLPYLVSLTGCPRHRLAFVSTHLSELQDLPLLPGTFIHSSFFLSQAPFFSLRMLRWGALLFSLLFWNMRVSVFQTSVVSVQKDNVWSDPLGLLSDVSSLLGSPTVI